MKDAVLPLPDARRPDGPGVRADQFRPGAPPAAAPSAAPPPEQLPPAARPAPAPAPAGAEIPVRAAGEDTAPGNAAIAPGTPDLPSEVQGFGALDDLPDGGEKFWAAFKRRTIETDMWSYSARIAREMTDSIVSELPPDAQARVRAAEDNPGGYLASNAARAAIRRAQVFREVQAIRDLGPRGNPALADAPLGEDEFQQRLLDRRRAEWEEVSAILDVDGEGFAGFMGGLTRDVLDPINFALAPFGAGGGIARTLATETVLSGVAAAAGLPREFEVSRELDLPEPNVAGRILTEAVAGGVIATLPVALVRGVQAFRARQRNARLSKPEDVPEHVYQDAQAEAAARLREELAAIRSRPPARSVDTPATGARRSATQLPDFDFSANGNASPRTNRTGYIFGRLIEKGIEPHIAAGIVGNFMAEAGAGLNPRINEAVPVVPGSRGGFGLAQWTGLRRRQLEARYDDPGNIDNQIDFFLHEIGTTEAPAWARIQRAATAEEAAALVSQLFLRPGKPRLNKRIGFAKGIIDQWEGGQVPRGAPTAPSSYVPTTRTQAGYTSSGQVRTAAGTRIDVEYQVVDASDLVRASGDLQPRARSLGNSDEQISNMAATLDPVLLMPAPTADRGAPIVGPDNVIESGNGRFGAITRAAELHPDRADAYRQQIEAAGFDIPDSVRTPVLVGRRVSELDDAARRSFVVEAQDSGVARMTAVERGRAEAATLDPDTLARLNPARPLDDPANGDFLRAALSRLPRTERNAFVTPEGRLNADGRAAMERALFARAFNDADLLRRFTEREAGELRALMDALFEASPSWARLVADVADGAVRPEFDISGHVIEAMRLIGQARRLAATENLPTGRVLAELLDEPDLIEGAVSPLTRALTGKFWVNGRASPKDKVADFLTRYANEARRVGRTEEGLFAGVDVIDALRAVDAETFADLTEIGPARFAPSRAAPPEPDVRDVLPEGAFAEGALSRDAEAVDEIAMTDLRAAVDAPPARGDAEPAPGPEGDGAAAQAADADAAAQARATARAQGDAVLADGDFEVPIGEGQTISARALLDDIDDDMALDTVIATCTARPGNG